MEDVWKRLAVEILSAQCGAPVKVQRQKTAKTLTTPAICRVLDLVQSRLKSREVRQQYQEPPPAFMNTWVG